jgi:beta-glucosidase/6-phospho-beta-glucosidase/beta-galactosidase
MMPQDSSRTTPRSDGTAALQGRTMGLAGGLSTGTFAWAVGVESSTLPHLGADQFEWTQHNLYWRNDLVLVRHELGLRHLRYSIPWSYVEPRRGHFDWRIADERIEACRQLGIVPILDIVHFGTPLWLSQAVGDPEFPDAVERLAAAMVRRYRSVVSMWCPFNEPLVTALFAGDYGLWPPHARRWRGYMPVLSRVAQGVARAIRAIRAEQPEAQVLLCDAADQFRSRNAELAQEIARRNMRRFLMLDLLTARVDSRHPLYDWLVAYGMSELDLRWFAEHPQPPDVVGLDYYSHSDWELELTPRGVRQRRADSPAGLYGVAIDYYQRFALPMMLTETSIEGKPISREIWLDRTVNDIRRLREEGVPMLGATWWPLMDHLDWDGALTHRIGKFHQVGLYKLSRQPDGRLSRVRTGLAAAYAKLAQAGNQAVGELSSVALPLPQDEDVMPISGEQATATVQTPAESRNVSVPTTSPQAAPPQTPVATDGAPAVVAQAPQAPPIAKGIIVFSHLRWGFVWQRPQQFLSRFARKHPVLFVEEPLFDQHEGTAPFLRLHPVMPNVTVACMHGPASWAQQADLPEQLRRLTREALEGAGKPGAFDKPLLWYYSPMDSSWTLGHFDAGGVIYDCMDELSQFTGAPEDLVSNERRLMQHADIVFTGGYELFHRKSQSHKNVHFFGCGVEAEHFGAAMDPGAVVPPDIDFISRPIFGWFGVIDERVDYHLVAEVARQRPDWSFVMIGPVVKVDPNLLPHAPNLFWLGARDYTVLPNYCKAFDVCMMCFAVNKATEFINPTKALEYLATGRPVISTPIADVKRHYDGLIDIAGTVDEFVAAGERALSHPDPERIKRGLDLAAASTWDSVVERMEELIAAAVAAADRPSAQPAQPLPNVKLTYKYISTPGS